jgi:hypothetical protein
MAAKLTRLTHKIVIQLYLVAESCTICSSLSRRSVRKLLDTPSYVRFMHRLHEIINIIYNNLVSGTLKDAHGLRMFGNRLVRRIFGLKWKEVVGDWRRLHNKELHNLYALPDVIRVI